MTLWSRCIRDLQAEIPEQQFNTWIRPLQAVEDGLGVIIDSGRVAGPLVNDATVEGYIERGVKCVGQIGLEVPPGFGDRIVNIPWSRKYIPFGWTGAHTDITSEDFVRAVLSKHVVTDPTQTASKYTHTIIPSFPTPTTRSASAATATPSKSN